MNIQKLLGATTPVVIEHGDIEGVPLKIILHAKLDALAGAGKTAYDELERREAALTEKIGALLDKLEVPDGIKPLSAEQQAALADYIGGVFDALALPDADRVALLAEHRPALDKFAAMLRTTPEQEKKQAAALKKAMEKAEADAKPLAEELALLRAEKLCFLVARAETQAGDQPHEPVGDWNAAGVAQFSPDTFAELFEAVSKKVLARWRNR